MCFSLNCLLLGEEYRTSFSVITGAAIVVSNYNINHKKILVSHIKPLVFYEISDKLKSLNINNSASLELWKVDGEKVENNKNKLEGFSTKDDIKNILGGEYMESNHFLNRYFTEDNFKNKITDEEAIHIIVQVPASTDQGRFRDTANLKYVPRREGNLGGTLLCPDELTSNTNEGISLSDKDTFKRTEVVKSLINDLLDKKVILVRAPPYSGKTALTQLIEDYLVNSSEFSTYRVIRFSALWGNDIGKLCDWNNFGEAWEAILGVDWSKWREECNIIPSILIIDEIQKIYRHSYQHSEPESMDLDGNNNTAAIFWESVKRILQGSKNIYIIMFETYGFGSAQGNLSTPVEIGELNSKSIFDIRFTDHELEEYVPKYCRCFNLKEDNKNIVPEFIKYIKNATAGHVGFVRHILYYTREHMKQKVNDLTWNDIIVYLNSNGFNETINNRRGLPKIKTFSKEQKLICENVLLKANISYQSNNRDIMALIKSGVLVINNYTLQFSTPIVMRSFIYQYYGNEGKFDEDVPTSLYDFIVRVFTALCLESKELLKNSLGYGKNKVHLEQMWQKEFYRIGKRLLNGYFMSCDVGATFKSNGYVYFYVDQLNWAIGIVRERRDMAEHAKRFDVSTGIYKEIEITFKAESYSIIDLRYESYKVRSLSENFVYVSYSENYDAFKIECFGKKPMYIK